MDMAYTRGCWTNNWLQPLQLTCAKSKPSITSKPSGGPSDVHHAATCMHRRPMQQQQQQQQHTSLPVWGPILVVRPINEATKCSAKA
jgi:hypothetical protein